MAKNITKSPIVAEPEQIEEGASDEILAEDLKSGREALSAVVEQFKVETEAEALVDLIRSVEERINNISPSSTPSRKNSLLQGGSKAALEIKQLTQSSRDDLSLTLSHVQEVHKATLDRRVKRGVALGALDYLDKIDKALKELLETLDSEKASPTIALSEFRTRSHTWLRQSSGSAAAKTAAVVNDSLLSASQSVSRSAALASASFTSSDSRRDEPCPLEASIRASNIFGRLSNNLNDFTSWALGETNFSDVHSKVGSVRSVHLYREREAPLHHEFALISLGGDGIPQSWIRVERAALLKSRKLFPKWDSFGPIFKGAPLRETITIAPEKSMLSGDAEELASVDNIQPMSSPSSPPLYVDELARQLVNTSESRPMYQLLTANCRWFARTTMLNCINRFSQSPVVVFAWHGSSVNVEDVSRRLLEDRFGGKQLRGSTADLLHAANVLEAQAKQLIDNKPKSVLKSNKAAIESLSRVTVNSTKKQYLTAHALFLRGTALRMLNHFTDAATRLALALSILRPILTESNDYELLYLDAISSLSYVRYLQKKYTEAATLRAELVEGWRRQREQYIDIDSALGLARALGFYARSLPALKDPSRNEEAIRSIDEALALVGDSHHKRDDLAGEALAWVLSQKAAILADLGKTQDALPIIQASVEQTRGLYKLKPDTLRRGFAARLYVLATIAHRVKPPQWDVGCEATRESMVLYRACYGAAPFSYQVDLEKRIAGVGTALRRASADVGVRAFVSLEAVVQSLSELLASKTSSSRAASSVAAGGSEEVADVDESREVQIHRETLIFALSTYAHLLGKSSETVNGGLGARDADEVREQVIAEIEGLGGSFAGKPALQRRDSSSMAVDT